MCIEAARVNASMDYVSREFKGEGYIAGFPNFHQADHGNGIVNAIFCIKEAAVDFKSISGDRIGNPNRTNMMEMFRIAANLASEDGYPAAIPSLHHDRTNNLYGFYFFKPEYVDWKDVKANDLGNPTGIAERFRAVNDYSISLLYNGGFPNFHQADYGEGVVFGTNLIKGEAGGLHEVPLSALNMPFYEEVFCTPNKSTSVIPNIGETSRVCLQTWMGTYVCAENGGGNLCVVNRPEARAWESFELCRLDEVHITLKAHNGQFLSAEQEGRSLVVAISPEAKEKETFKMYIDQSGLVAISAYNGKYFSAESDGILTANRDVPKSWEGFRIVSPDNANIKEQTQVVVNVYKIITAPIWHTGTVIGDREYYFQTSNRVESCDPEGMDLPYHRKIVRHVPGNLDSVKSVLDMVSNDWNGTRYDVAGHNCNFFTNDLLNKLGVPGLDQEYLEASGFAKGFSQIPGSSLFQEVIVKWPIDDKRLDVAFMDELVKLARLPADTVNEVGRFFKRIGFPGGGFTGIRIPPIPKPF
ncbi:Fascin domain-containing protein [Paenibacillus sp. OK060]|uniref:DUF7910 domain-containing protein n=1 Tax=Paenibacillus sp. OK060 TaxID=1881034 RepID=UPI000891DCEF|nr:hypothetical protein [Paenibacillus sp. OK060]SDM17094.1 Fascin domain-containing protein [Paenibacillus sp. OK060]